MKSDNVDINEQEFLDEFKRRFMFYSNTAIRIVSIEDKLDSVWDIVKVGRIYEL